MRRLAKGNGSAGIQPAFEMDEQLKEKTDQPVKLGVQDAEPAQLLQPISKNKIAKSANEKAHETGLLPAKIAMVFAVLLFAAGASILIGTFFVCSANSDAEGVAKLWLYQTQFAFLWMLCYAGVLMAIFLGYLAAHIYRNGRLSVRRKCFWLGANFLGLICMLPIPSIVYLNRYAFPKPPESDLQKMRRLKRKSSWLVALGLTSAYWAFVLHESAFRFTLGSIVYPILFGYLTSYIAWVPLLILQMYVPQKGEVASELMEFVRNAMPKLFADWDLAPLKELGTTQLTEFAHRFPVGERWQTHQANLGALTEIKSIRLKQNSIGPWTVIGGKQCTANCSVKAVFERGSAQIDLKLVCTDDQSWRIWAIFIKPQNG